ncbi:DUF5615 family PIN-like protein [Devosia geojensis]|uniref:DUF5615 family PIN-like protein n=1 Tax=Devosia geojensis TaxID=443610 RepID=UPI001364B4EB
MRFLLDAQLPPGLVGPLMQAGHECVHVTKHLAGDASDMAVAELASALDAVLIIFPRAASSKCRGSGSDAATYYAWALGTSRAAAVHHHRRHRGRAACR